MATPVLDLQGSQASGASTTATVTVVGAAAGSTIMFAVGILADRTITAVSDGGVGITWNQRAYNGTQTSREIYLYEGYYAAGGNVTVSVTISGAGSPSWVTNWASFTGVSSTSPFDVSDTNDASGASSPAFCAQSGSIDTTTDVAVVCAMATTSKDFTASSGFTRIGSGATQMAFAYRTSAAALTDERGGFSWSTGTILYGGAIASWKADPPAAGGNAGQLLLLGCGA